MMTLSRFSRQNEAGLRALTVVREGTFFIGVGWAGALEGRVISKYFTNWGGSNLFDTQPREGHSFFGKENITPCRLVDFYLLTNTRSV